ncbi:MAG: glycosyltransferase [Kordiimonadaceae bacterium]|nr:glycosyltransferase [Kordiimonadaceae bacterium]
MNSQLTIAIVAHNAEATIERAVLSARQMGDYAILLVADGCTDATVKNALRAGGECLTVAQLTPNQGVGAARAQAISQIQTPYGLWLDADDECMPSRAEDMLIHLKAGADMVLDSGVLVSSATGQMIKELPIPDFMQGKNQAVRCFERNWFPVLAGGFNVAFARSVGFDPNFRSVEDYDFLLRAIAQGGDIRALPTLGYRYYHAPDSLSRKVSTTQENVQKALLKHSFEQVAELLAASSVSAAEIGCLQAGMALYRQDFKAAKKYADSIGFDDTIVAPYGLTASFLRHYFTASASAKLGDWQHANVALQGLVEGAPVDAGVSADVWNNLGVTLHHMGEKAAATQAFEKALQEMPDYLDAVANLRADVPQNYTLHPLRRQASRNKYS